MITRRHRLLQFPVATIIGAYYLLTAAVRPIARPISRGLAKLKILAPVREAIERLGPYPSLLLLLVPIVIIEPLKLGSLMVLGSGRVVLGTAALLVSHGLSLIIVEKLFELVKPKLLQLPWFAVLWIWFEAIRDRLLTWLHSTWAWSVILRVRYASRLATARFLSALGLSWKV